MMTTAIFILLMLLTLISGASAYFYYKQSIRVNQTLDQIDHNANSLNNTLVQHKSSVERMPQNFEAVVSKELSLGLNQTVSALTTLQGNLDRTHQSFQALAQNIPQLDSMPEWLSDVKKSIEPLRSAALGIQGLDDKVLVHFNHISSGRDNMEKAFTHIATIIKDWSNESNVVRGEFKRLVQGHLDNLALESNKMQSAMAEVQSFTKVMGQFKDHFPEAVMEFKETSKNFKNLLAKTEENTQKTAELLAHWDKRWQQQQILNYITYLILAINAFVLVKILL